MNYTTQIVNTIKDNINESIEKSLIDIDLESMFKYKIDFEKQQQEIRTLKKEKNELIQEMDNFKKVSIFKSMTEQIDEKNREIKILKSIIKNKEKTIEILKKNDKSNFFFEESRPNSLTSESSSEFTKHVQKQEETDQTREPLSESSKEVLETEKKEPSLEVTIDEQESEDSVPTPESSQEESTSEEKETSLEVTKDTLESENTQPEPETPIEESTLEEKEPSLEVTKDALESEDTELSPETPKEESTPEERETSSKMVSDPDQTEEMKVIKKLKGKNYYIIKNTIFEIKNNKKVGDKVGVCIIEGKKKKYKFTNKK